MKVTPAHLDELREAIEPLDTDERRTIYRDGKFPRADKVKNLDERYRWDLYWAASRVTGGLPDSTNGYATSHIDTALRKIVQPLG